MAHEWLKSLDPIEQSALRPSYSRVMKEGYFAAPWADDALSKAAKRWRAAAADLQFKWNTQAGFGPATGGSPLWGYTWDLLVPADIERLSFDAQRGFPLGTKGDWRVRLWFRGEEYPYRSTAFAHVKRAGEGICLPAESWKTDTLIRKHDLSLKLTFEAKKKGLRRNSRPWIQHFEKMLMPKIRPSNGKYRVTLWEQG